MVPEAEQNSTQLRATDAALMQSVSQGEEEAVRTFYEAYADAVLRFVYPRIGERYEDAEEVTQDAFVRARRGLKNFRGEATFSTWLYQIAANLAHNRYWYWKRRRRDASLPLETGSDDENVGSLLNVLPTAEESPLEAAVAQELVDRIAECLHKLPKKHRQILVMRAIHNFSYEKMAQKLGIRVGTGVGVSVWAGAAAEHPSMTRQATARRRDRLGCAASLPVPVLPGLLIFSVVPEAGASSRQRSSSSAARPRCPPGRSDPGRRYPGLPPTKDGRRSS